MEDVLDLMLKKPDRKRPVVCFTKPDAPAKMDVHTEKAR